MARGLILPPFYLGSFRLGGKTQEINLHMDEPPRRGPRVWALGAHSTLRLLAPCSPEAPTLWPGFCVDLGFRDPRTECRWAGLHAACISSGKRLTSCIQGLSREGPGPIKSHSASCCLHLSTRAVDGCLECVMATQSPSPCPRTVLPLQRMTAGPGSPIPPVCKPPGASPCRLSPTLQPPFNP